MPSIMQLSNLLECASLENARLVVPPLEINVPITGINILEAPDIEKWGKKGLVILTSFYALQGLSQFQLEEFFDKLKSIGIYCLIVKINRLLKEIPTAFIALCRSHGIALIEIDEKTKYEDIISEVLGFILARREQRLSLYYQLSKISSRMAIDMLGTHEILREFKQFLQLDLTLENISKGISISTNPRLTRYDLLEELPLAHWEFMTFDYKRHRVLYQSSGDGKEGSLIRIDIPSFEGNKYVLLIHENKNHMFDVNDVIVIENLTLSLQFELLREFSAKQRQLLNKNSLVNDVLRGIFTVKEEFAAACAQLNLDPKETVQVLTIDFYPEGEPDGIALYDLRSNLRTEIKRIHPRSIYYIAPGYDQFILPIESSATLLKSVDFKELLTDLIKQSESLPKLRFHGGISNTFKVSEIDLADLQSKAVASFLNRNYPYDTIEEYNNLGIFKLFVNESNRDLSEFVKPEIMNLYQEQPELFKTISVYLKTGRSYTRTAEELFLHPKTVKYRIEKISEILHLDLDNVQDGMILLTSIEILSFRSGHMPQA